MTSFFASQKQQQMADAPKENLVSAPQVEQAKSVSPQGKEPNLRKKSSARSITPDKKSGQGAEDDESKVIFSGKLKYNVSGTFQHHNNNFFSCIIITNL